MDDLLADTDSVLPRDIPELLVYLDEKFPVPVLTDPQALDDPKLKRDVIARMHRREVVEHLRRMYRP